MAGEEYWYGEGWRTLRRNTVSVCLQHAPVLLDTLDQGKPESIDSALRHFVGAVLRTMEERRGGGQGSGLWDHAIALFGEVELLTKSVRGVLDFISRFDGDPRVILVPAFTRYIEKARRACQIGNAARRAVWERLDRISRSLPAPSGANTSRCNIDHFVEIVEHVRRNHSGDHNLPRTVQTVREYFFEFSTDCRQDLSDDIAFGLNSSPNDIDVLVSVTGVDIDLERCVMQLPDEFRNLIENRYYSPLASRNHMQLYCQTHGISRSEYYRRHSKALKLLQSCVSSQIEKAIR